MTRIVGSDVLVSSELKEQCFDRQLFCYDSLPDLQPENRCVNGTVRHIQFVPAQGAHPKSVDEVQAVTAAGLRGDQYFQQEGTFTEREGSELTLIESEALAAVERDYGIDLDPGRYRRNVTTEAISLNHLIDKRFQVGHAVCLGTELCEPRSYLERHFEQHGVREALLHWRGLRCRILDGGRIRVGDEITAPEHASDTSRQLYVG